MAAPFHLRPYRDRDAQAAIALWQRSWQHAYPDIDFAARLEWWRQRWQDELVPSARIVVAESEAAALAGFVTIDGTGYLDQLVVAPERWGDGVAAALVADAKRLSPTGVRLTVNADNARAIRFYQKAGFADAGGDINARSGRAVRHMVWRP
jgi:putative acetyltransferase